MKNLKKLVVSALLLLAVFGFLTIITEMPTASAQGGDTRCIEDEDLHCWTSGEEAWICLNFGAMFCRDPVN